MGPGGAVDVLAPARGWRRCHCPPDLDSYQVLSSDGTRGNHNEEPALSDRLAEV